MISKKWIVAVLAEMTQEELDELIYFSGAVDKELILCQDCQWQKEELFTKEKVCPICPALGQDNEFCSKGIKRH